jgi:hypothetical protein
MSDMKNIHFACCLLLSLIGSALGQEYGPRPALPVYKVELTVRETGPDKTETRHYALVVQDGGSSRVNIGDRVPLVTGPAGNTQYSMYDIGTDLNCKLRERDNQVLLDVELSRTAVTLVGGLSSTTTSNVRTSASAALVPGKSTEIVKWDDSQAKKTFVLEAEANRMK